MGIQLLKLVRHALLSLPVTHMPLLPKTITAQPDRGFRYGRSSKRDSLRFTNDTVAGPRTTLKYGHSAPMILRSPSPVCQQHDNQQNRIIASYFLMQARHRRAGTLRWKSVQTIRIYGPAWAAGNPEIERPTNSWGGNEGSIV